MQGCRTALDGGDDDDERDDARFRQNWCARVCVFFLAPERMMCISERASLVAQR